MDNSRSEGGIAPGGGGAPNWRGVQYIYLIGCQLPQLDVAMCLVLTIDVYGYPSNRSRDQHTTYTHPTTSKSCLWTPCSNFSDSPEIEASSDQLGAIKVKSDRITVLRSPFFDNISGIRMSQNLRVHASYLPK